MAGIWMRRSSLQGELSDLVGYKSGLALTRDQLMAHMADLPQYQGIWQGDLDKEIRIRTGELQAVLAHLLYRVGVVSSSDWVSPELRILQEYRDQPMLFNIALSIGEFWAEQASKTTGHSELWPPHHIREGKPDPLLSVVDPVMARVQHLHSAMERLVHSGGRFPDDKSFEKDVSQRFGNSFVDIANRYCIEAVEYVKKTPWKRIRHCEWTDVVELRDLFESESLEVAHGGFIDQRYIDYLDRNFASIDQVNWRKFEAITGEFFSKNGFSVEMGPGRNDDNIDIRVWPSQSSLTKPPALLVQCKREKEKIGKVIVKALWADLVNEGAHAGLIVTTNKLSPGAKNIVAARSYPIMEADRDTLRRWISSLRSPETGVFLGE